MTSFTPIMMFGWIPVTILLFSVLGTRRAAAASLILGWLFLPGVRFNFPGLPDYTKTISVCFPIILSTLIFDSMRLQKLRLGKIDIPIIVFCCCAFASSISNGLGTYDGISGMLRQIFEWGCPYAIGRMYFSDDQGLRELAIWVVIGGLVYVPFCLWEMRMSPNLHYYIYGFRQDTFGTTIRFGGYRPVVFMQHGIALGLWMMSAVLMAVSLWRTECVKVIMGMPSKLNMIILSVIFILCRSLNAILLICLGFFAFYAIGSRRWKIIILLLVLLPVFYVGVRYTGVLSSEKLVSYANIIDEDRARSLHGRLYHEELLLDKAKNRPVFGWGGWGRNRLKNEYGKDISVTDGLWIIVFGVNGFVGLISIGLVLLMPTFLFWKRYRHLDWKVSAFAPIVGFITILPLYVIDCLLNAMVNPVFTVAVGGLLGWLSVAENTPGRFMKENETEKK